MTEQAQSFSTENTKQFLKLGFAVPKLLKQAKENDGKIDINDIGLAMQLIPLIGPAFDDIALIPKELADLDETESQDLLTFAASEVGGVFTNEELIIKINKGLKAGFAIYDLIQEF